MKHEHKYFNEPGDDWTVEESDDGVMSVWVGNEYYVKVNFCPVCGERAKHNMVNEGTDENRANI